MIVCVCEGISDSEIRTHVAAGASDVETLQRRCAAGTCCGQWRDMLKCLVGSDSDDRQGDKTGLGLAGQTTSV